MKGKTLSLGVFGFLALALMISFASATITISDSTPLNPSIYGSFTFTVNSTNYASDGYVTGSLSPLIEGSSQMNLNTNISSTPNTFNVDFAAEPYAHAILVTYNPGTINFNYAKTYSTTITAANATPSSAVTKTVTFEQRPYCDNVTNNGNLNVEITDIKTVYGFGDNDNYWYPIDQVEIEVNVDNQGSYDISGIEVRWALYTTAGVKISDEKLSTFKLKDGDEKTLTFTITLDENIDDFDGENAVLLVKAKGKISSDDSHDNEYTCSSDSNTIDVITDDDFVILRDFILNAETLENDDLNLNTPVMCGDTITIQADVWNIQNSDQDEVSVEIYNKELGINQIISVGDIRSFDNEKLNTQFQIPDNVAEKWYDIVFSVLNEDDDVFENSEDGFANFHVKVKVANCTANLVPSLSAQLASEAIAGKDLMINAIITNSGTSTVTYALNVAGFADWATLKNISTNTVTLAPGQTQTVQIIFETTKASAGDRFFNLEVLANNQFVASQPVAVSLAAKKTTAVGDFIVSNWKLLGIILLNLILVIAIIVVIVRLYRR
jgi:hypothetical protein